MGGQLVLAIGCIGMLVSRTPIELSVAYTTVMLGSSIGWGVYLCLLPEFIPEVQHGTASGNVHYCNSTTTVCSHILYNRSFRNNASLGLTYIFDARITDYMETRQ